jgi:hypothetical protein
VCVCTRRYARVGEFNSKQQLSSKLHLDEWHSVISPIVQPLVRRELMLAFWRQLPAEGVHSSTVRAKCRTRSQEALEHMRCDHCCAHHSTHCTASKRTSDLNSSKGEDRRVADLCAMYATRVERVPHGGKHGSRAPEKVGPPRRSQTQT